MQALIDRIFENKGFLFVAWAIALLFVAALILFVFRLAFGRRLKTSGGGRTRLPRLGVVDAFDLDRHRQLVIVRRDNIEHLLMIGGPNDLVIESEIIRAEGRDLRLRDKDARDKEPREALQAPVQAPAPAAPPWQPQSDPAPGRISASQQQAPRKMPIPPLAPIAPAPDLEVEPPAPVIDEPVAAPAPRAPSFPLPPRRAAQSLTAPQRAAREPLGRPESAAEDRGRDWAIGRVFQRAPLATPFLRPPRQLADPGPKPSAAPAHSANPLPASSVPANPASTTGATADLGRDAEPTATTSDAAMAASEAVTPPSDAVTALSPAPEPSAPFPTEDRGSAAPPASVGADKLADGAGKAPGAKEPAFADTSILASTDSLDHSLEEEMARLLGRGP